MCRRAEAPRAATCSGWRTWRRGGHACRVVAAALAGKRRQARADRERKSRTGKPSRIATGSRLSSAGAFESIPSPNARGRRPSCAGRSANSSPTGCWSPPKIWATGCCAKRIIRRPGASFISRTRRSFSLSVRRAGIRMRTPGAGGALRGRGRHRPPHGCLHPAAHRAARPP